MLLLSLLRSKALRPGSGMRARCRGTRGGSCQCLGQARRLAGSTRLLGRWRDRGGPAQQVFLPAAGPLADPWCHGPTGGLARIQARAGDLPRGTGFIARFLIAWPASTHGQGLYRPAPAEMAAVDRFNRRNPELRDMPLITNGSEGTPAIVAGMSPSLLGSQ